MSYIQKCKIHILVLLSFLLITFIYFPPLFSGFFTKVETNDGRLVAGLLSWDIHKLLTDPLHIFSGYFFYPNRNTLAYTEHFIGAAIPAIPVWLLTGGNPAATFNFCMISGYVLNAYFTFLLIRRFIPNNYIAFTGAFINGFCAYRLFNIGHLQDIVVFYIPLCLYFFYEYLEKRGKWQLGGMLFCLFMQSLSSWYHMIFIFMMLTLFIGYYTFIDKQLKRRDVLWLSGVYIFCFILIIPFAAPYLELNKKMNTAYTMADVTPADIGGYLIPAPYTFGCGFFSEYLGISKSRWTENINFLGFSVLFLSSLGLFASRDVADGSIRFRLRRDRMVFFGTACLFFLFSLGPFLFFNDHQTRLKLPYYFVFKYLSSLRFLRTISRYSTVVFLMTSILAAYGLEFFVWRMDLFRRRVVQVLVFAVIFLEFTPVPRFDRFTDMSARPAVYDRIKGDTAVKALVELPIDIGPFETTKYLYYGGLHFKPIVNGYSGYEPPSYSRYKQLFNAPISDFTRVSLQKLGVTNILCDPGYRQPVDTSVADLVMEDGGYRLYKLKPSIDSEALVNEDMSKPTEVLQSTDPMLRVTRSFRAAAFYPATQFATIGYISPDSINRQGAVTYLSNQPLDGLSVQFRSYTANDTLRIRCLLQRNNEPDSIIKMYTFPGTNEYNEKYLNLSLYKANKVIIELYATVFTDRTFIRNLTFIKK